MNQLIKFATIPNFIYFLFFVWVVVSIKLIRKTIKGSEVNEYFYSSIPNVFTTIGILGTFIGIYIGLQGFDTNEISSSIPTLLEGLKTAFLTSIIGIVFSLIFGRISELALGFAYSSKEKVPTNELQALRTINDSLIKLRSDYSDSKKIAQEQNIELKNIYTALGDDSENSLSFQLKKIQLDSNDNFRSLFKNLENNKQELHKKFSEFAQLLAENNTEALVDIMKSATEEFNNQMSALINKLVQENFSELNNSVKQLNNWQIENKLMVSDLTEKHKEIVTHLNISSKSIKDITSNSETIVSHVKELVNEKSKLNQIVEALRKVMIEDERFENSTNNLLSAIEKVEKNIDSFDNTSNKLNDWIQKEHGVKDSITSLLIKLDEVANIKSYNGEFWNETKKQLNEGTQLIVSNTEKLSSNLDGINQEFQAQLGDILGSLDELIKRLIIKANEN